MNKKELETKIENIVGNRAYATFELTGQLMRLFERYHSEKTSEL